MKISVAMIVRNEEVLLERALSSVLSADEIVVVDTGSSDSTVDIARRFTDKVYTDYAWNDDFSEARNVSIERCSGDWVVILDADEFLEDWAMDVIREKIVYATTDAATLDLISESGDTSFRQIRIIKPHIRYKGKAHNYVSVSETEHIPVSLVYGHSPAHDLDPDRTFRILGKYVAEHPDCVREMYYYAREFYYRKAYADAAYWWEKYVLRSTWIPEVADAHLYLARCYWVLMDGNRARDNCLRAIALNPSFQEALDFMGDISFPEESRHWKKYASYASNENVLFLRKS